MEENNPSIFKNALYYGLLTGAGMIVYSLILYLINQYMNTSLSYVAFLILIGGMIWGTLEYRKKSGGFLVYGKSFASCFQIGLVAAVLVAVYTLLFVTVIYPGYIDELINYSREIALQRNPGMDETQVDQAMGFSRKFMSPVLMPIFSLLGNVFWSVIISLILAIFLKKEDKSISASV